MSFEEKLIEQVQKFDILYKKSSGGYKNVFVKSQTWLKIAEQLNSSVEQCQMRWKSLRDRFSKETMKRNTPSGSGATTYAPWEYYESLTFLKEHIKPRTTRSNLEKTHSATLEEYNVSNDCILFSPTNVMEEESVETTEIPKSKKKLKIDLEDVNSKFMKTMDTFQDYFQDKPPPKTENNSFSNAICVIINELAPEKQKRAKAKILSILAQIGNED